MLSGRVFPLNPSQTRVWSQSDTTELAPEGLAGHSLGPDLATAATGAEGRTEPAGATLGPQQDLHLLADATSATAGGSSNGGRGAPVFPVKQLPSRRVSSIHLASCKAVRSEGWGAAPGTQLLLLWISSR